MKREEQASASKSQRIPLVYSATSPQTGLDAANAHHIVQLLKDLAGEGRTVIVAIHTPRPEIWELFDHILLLSQGHVLYNGSTSSIRGYFERCGHAISASENPAEHLIDLVSIEAEAEGSPMGSVARINNLKEQWKAAQRNRFRCVSYSWLGYCTYRVGENCSVPLGGYLAFSRGLSLETWANFCSAQAIATEVEMGREAAQPWHRFALNVCRLWSTVLPHAK